MTDIYNNGLSPNSALSDLHLLSLFHLFHTLDTLFFCYRFLLEYNWNALRKLWILCHVNTGEKGVFGCDNDQWSLTEQSGQGSGVRVGSMGCCPGSVINWMSWDELWSTRCDKPQWGESAVGTQRESSATLWEPSQEGETDRDCGNVWGILLPSVHSPWLVFVYLKQQQQPQLCPIFELCLSVMKMFRSQSITPWWL